MNGKHAQKNFGAVGTMAPTPISQNPGGGGGAGGCRIQGPGPAAPPPPVGSLVTMRSDQCPLSCLLYTLLVQVSFEGSWGMVCCSFVGDNIMSVPLLTVSATAPAPVLSTPLPTLSCFLLTQSSSHHEACHLRSQNCYTGLGISRSPNVTHQCCAAFLGILPTCCSVCSVAWPFSMVMRLRPEPVNPELWVAGKGGCSKSCLIPWLTH